MWARNHEGKLMTSYSKNGPVRRLTCIHACSFTGHYHAFDRQVYKEVEIFLKQFQRISTAKKNSLNSSSICFEARVGKGHFMFFCEN